MMSKKFHQGITIQSIVLGSDATHLTNFAGDKSIHAVYITLGNIEKELRHKSSFKCWMVLAYLPKPKFAKTKFSATHTIGETEGMPTLCRKIFVHEALRHILAPLHIDDGHPNRSSGVKLQRPRIRLDASGRHQEVISVLMSWSVDLQEHLDLLGLGTYSGAKCAA